MIELVLNIARFKIPDPLRLSEQKSKDVTKNMVWDIGEPVKNPIIYMSEGISDDFDYQMKPQGNFN